MRLLLVILIALVPLSAVAQDRLVTLYAPPALIETGLLKFILPRFSLKTQVKVELVGDPTGADVAFGSDGQPVFQDADQVWAVTVRKTPATGKLMDWMTSEVGRRTIFGYAPDGEALFEPPAARAVAAAPVEIGEDAIWGLQISKAKCARCHAVDEATRKTTIGSTPSFFVLRTFADWELRFSTFYVLKPHPAFTQIDDVTEPFPADRPSPIVPIEMSIEEVEAVLAYVAAIKAADLGKPLEHQ